MSKYVIFGDCHLRYDIPICRKETQEEWLAFQKKQLQTIVSTARTNNAVLVCTGDFYDAAREPSEVQNMAVSVLLPEQIPVWMIAGNHSLLYHREANRQISSIGLFQYFPNVVFPVAAENIYGTRFEHSVKFTDDITVVHTLCFEKETPFGIDACTAHDLLDKYNTKWIFTGDMHEPFIYSADGRYVINPGKMTVQSTREAKIPPCFYLVDTDTEKIDIIYLDNPEISEEHLTEQKERDTRISEAIKLIKTGKQVSLSFRDNLKHNMQNNNVSIEVQEIIQEIENKIKENKQYGY
jgi:DNA repair exonuclease SbcCD nuclease subunit